MSIRESLFQAAALCPEAVVCCTEEGHIVFANDEAKRLLGLMNFPADLCSLPSLMSLVHGEQWSTLLSADNKTRKAFEAQLPTPTGDNLCLLISCREIVSDKELRWCTLRDNGPNKRAMDLLRKTCNLQRRILETSAAAIIVTDSKGVITAINEAFLTITGIPSDEVIGQHCDTFFTEDCEELTVFELLADGKPLRQVHCVLRARNGRKLTVMLNIERTYKTIVGSFIDLTDFNEAKEAAEAASKAKDAFLANMSHEIRTPLNGIIGIAELALTSEPKPEIERLLQLLIKSGTTLQTLVNDILDLSKVNAGKISLELLNSNIVETLETALIGAKVAAEKKGLKLQMNFAKDLPLWLHLDQLRLSQVLNNLVSNAIKFTEEGTVSLDVCALPTKDEDLKVQFKISDTGVGIPEDKLSTIFSPFTQSDVSISRKYGGTGLGLTISRQLVDLMGGAIVVESQMGVGSTFTFTIATQIGQCPQKDVAAEKTIAKVEEPMDLLIVDDNSVNRLLFSGLLSRRGHNVSLAKDGMEALEMANERAFDLILMDVHMPNRDGLETTKLIRQGSGPNNKTNIFALTACSLPEDKARFAAAGMNGHIEKPIRASLLFSTVEGSGKRKKEVARAFDKEKALSNAEGSERLWHLLLEAFKTEHLRYLELIDKASVDRNLTALHEAAHGLQGAAGNVAAVGVYEAALALANKAKDGQMEDVKSLLVPLQQAVAVMQKEMESIVSGKESSAL